jgi:hypothetical protein
MRYHPAIRLLWRAAPQEAFWWHLHNMPPRWALCVERRVFHNGMTARQAFSDCRAGMCAEVPVEKRAGGLVGLLALAAGAVIVLQEAKA